MVWNGGGKNDAAFWTASNTAVDKLNEVLREFSYNTALGEDFPHSVRAAAWLSMRDPDVYNELEVNNYLVLASAALIRETGELPSDFVHGINDQKQKIHAGLSGSSPFSGQIDSATLQALRGCFILECTDIRIVVKTPFAAQENCE
jgi:hypothetical protein